MALGFNNNASLLAYQNTHFILVKDEMIIERNKSKEVLKCELEVFPSLPLFDYQFSILSDKQDRKLVW